MFKRVGFTYVQKENFQLVKTLGFYFVRFNIVGIIFFDILSTFSTKKPLVLCIFFLKTNDFLIIYRLLYFQL